MHIWEQFRTRVAWSAAKIRGRRFRVSHATDLFRTTEQDVAAEYLRDSLEIFPGEPGLLLLRAEQFHKQGNTSSAIDDVVAATKAEKIDVANQFRCVEIFESLQQFELAEAVCQQLTNHTCHLVRSHAYFQMARMKIELDQTAALRLITKSICLDDHTHACTILYSCKWDDREVMLESLGLLQEAAKDNSRGHRLHMAIADLAMKLEKFDVGEKYVKSATRVKIEHSPKLKKRLGDFSFDAKPMKPDFLIIGAMKCGTSSLHNFIHQHPQCVEPLRKEIRFFHNDQFPLEWYLSHFPPTPKNVHLKTGEASPGYLNWNNPGRISELFPKIKLICILRNPMRRTLSQYHHVRNKFRPRSRMRILINNIEKFRDLNQVDDERAEEMIFDGMKTKTDARIALSFYYYFLRRWARHFPKEQLLLLSLRELKHDPHNTMRKVFDFLDLDTDFQCELKIQNTGKYLVPSDEEKEAERLLTELYKDSVDKLENEFDIHLGDV